MSPHRAHKARLGPSDWTRHRTTAHTPSPHARELAERAAQRAGPLAEMPPPPAAQPHAEETAARAAREAARPRPAAVSSQTSAQACSSSGASGTVGRSPAFCFTRGRTAVHMSPGVRPNSTNDMNPKFRASMNPTCSWLHHAERAPRSSCGGWMQCRWRGSGSSGAARRRTLCTTSSAAQRSPPPRDNAPVLLSSLIRGLLHRCVPSSLSEKRCPRRIWPPARSCSVCEPDPPALRLMIRSFVWRRNGLGQQSRCPDGAVKSCSN